MHEKEKKGSLFQGWKNYVSVGLTAFLVLAAAIAFYFLILRLPEIKEFFDDLLVILQPVLIGLAVAYLLHPIVEFFERQFRKLFGKNKTLPQVHKPSRMLAITVSLLLLLAVLYILAAMVLPELIVTISGIVSALPEQTNNLIKDAQRLLENHAEIYEQFKDVISDVADNVRQWMQTSLLPTMTNIALGLKDVVVILLNVVIGLVISTYVLSTREKFTGQAKKLLFVVVKKREKANAILRTVRMSNRVFSGFISGTLLKSLILGIACFILMSVLHLQYAMLISVVVGVTNVVPFFGPYAGAAIGTLLLVLQDPMQALYFLILILILQQIDGNVMAPLILGDSTGLSSFWVITSILVGGGLFGVLGMLLGVPVFAVFYHVVKSIVNERLAKKALPTDSMEFAYVDEISEDGEIEKLPPDVFYVEEGQDGRRIDKIGERLPFLKNRKKKETQADTDAKQSETDADADAGQPGTDTNADAGQIKPNAADNE